MSQKSVLATSWRFSSRIHYIILAIISAEWLQLCDNCNCKQILKRKCVSDNAELCTYKYNDKYEDF